MWQGAKNKDCKQKTYFAKRWRNRKQSAFSQRKAENNREIIVFIPGGSGKMFTSKNAVRVYSWQRATKRKINTEKKSIKGFVNSTVLIVALLLVCGAIYLYSINSSAVKGYQVRQVEKEIQELEKQNEDLKIREAELKSLYHVEESSKNMNMEDLKNISYIEETGPVAMK